MSRIRMGSTRNQHDVVPPPRRSAMTAKSARTMIRTVPSLSIKSMQKLLALLLLPCLHATPISAGRKGGKTVRGNIFPGALCLGVRRSRPAGQRDQVFPVKRNALCMTAKRVFPASSSCRRQTKSDDGSEGERGNHSPRCLFSLTERCSGSRCRRRGSRR